MTPVTSTAPPTHPDLLRLLDWWRAAAETRPWPARQDVDPLTLRWIIGWLLVVDVQGGGQYRYRLCGTRLSDAYGYDLTGRSLDEMPDPTYRERVRQSYDEAVTARAPVSGQRRIMVRNVPHDYENLILPLGAGDAVDHLLVAIVPLRAAAAPVAPAGRKRGA